MIDNLPQGRFARRQRRAAVGVPEEGGICQPGPDDPLVAVAHLAGILAVEVGYGDEARQKLAALVGDGEVALVAAQRRHDGLTGQPQVLLVK